MNDFKSNLETQTPYLWIILGRKNSPLTKDFKFYYDKLQAWCKINAKLYAFIGHDKDIDENGEPKFRHIHALIVLKSGCKPRLGTSLNRIADVTGLNAVDIDIEKAENVTSCIRYCLHKGYPDKYQYAQAELISNLNSEDLKEYLEIEENSFTANYLINLITICNCSLMTIMKQIGLKNYLKYRNAIKDVVDELNGSR